MPLTYQELRNAHFRFTLKTWFRGLDKAVVAIVAVLQFILTAIATMTIIGLAMGLRLLLDPRIGLWQHVLIVVAWQCVSFILLRALREATFMPRARAFFDALPVPPLQKLRADLSLSLLGYSLLWLPIAWMLVAPPDTPAHTDAWRALAPLTELVTLSVCVNTTLLRGAARHALASLGLLALYAFSHGTDTWVEPARFACSALAAAVLWHSYLPQPSRIRARPARSAFADGLARRSGLVTTLLANDLRSNLLVRIGIIAATLGACLVVIAVRASDSATASVVLFVAAVAALALYSLPMLCRTTLFTRLHFLAGQAAFARRMRLAAYGIPSVLFGAALAAAWPFDRSGTAPRDALVFSLCYLAGVAATRAGVKAIKWLMPLATMIALIVLGAML
jgi:hypothetical protein